MKAIVAVDKNWAIGFKGELLVSLPEDQKDIFKTLTMGNTVLYGRKTLDTFPGKRLLPGRTNVIVSRNRSFIKEGAIILHSKDEIIAYDMKHSTDLIYLIGGAEVYRTMLQHCSEAIVTSIDHAFMSDAFFQNLDAELAWKEISRSEVVHSAAWYNFSVHHYRNLNIEY